METTNKTRPSWDETFFELCEIVAQRSKDISTKVGSVIIGPDREVRSTGYNSFPRGIDDDVDKRQERPYKYYWFEHAERNAIYNAARVGTPLKGCTLYVPLMPCADCARAIIQAGIIEVVLTSLEVPEKWSSWAESMECSRQMFEEAGIIVREKR